MAARADGVCAASGAAVWASAAGVSCIGCADAVGAAITAAAAIAKGERKDFISNACAPAFLSAR